MWTGAGAINREPHLQGSCLEKASLLVVGPPGQGTSPSCSSDALSLFLSLSLPWPWPLSAPSHFQLSSVYCSHVLLPGRGHPGEGLSRELGLRPLGHSAQLSSSRCSLPCFLALARASCPLSWNCQHPRGPVALPPPPSLCGPCSSPGRLASRLDRGEATEPGHVSWPQAEPEPWPQSHTGQAQLCCLKFPEQVEGKTPPLGSVDPRPTPARSRSPGEARCGMAPSRIEVQPAIALSSPSVGPQGRAFPGRGNEKQGSSHSCGSSRGGS